MPKSVLNVPSNPSPVTSMDSLEPSRPSVTFSEVEFHKGMPEPAYRSYEGYNQSYLKTVYTDGILHAEHERLNPSEETEALRIGSLFHALVLEPKTVEQVYIVAPKVDRRTKEGKLEYDLFLSQATNKSVVSDREYLTATMMANSTIPHSLKHLHKDNCDFEIAFTGRATVRYHIGEEVHGASFPIKGKLDILAHKLNGDIEIRDLKSMGKLTNDDVRKSAKDRLWALQSAFYTDAVYAGFKPNKVDFVYYCTEKAAPYHTHDWQCTEEMLARGRGIYAHAFMQVSEWIRKGKPDTYDYLGRSTLNV